MKHLALGLAVAAAAFGSSAENVLRINEIGYLPDDVKVAVYLGDYPASQITATLSGSPVDSVVEAPAWGSIPYAARIYFSSAEPDEHVLEIKADGAKIAEREVLIAADAYSRLALNELPLVYLRQQRCGFNPVHNAQCHQHDGFLVLSGDSDGQSVDVRGGWHDASDYLQYLTTSANAVYQLLFAYRMQPDIWGDAFDAQGLPGANGVPDILDEARWGLEWMQRMNPADGVYLNQIADDRDHRFVGVPAADIIDYGRGPGAGRPVYPVCGEPYGLRQYKNRSTGEASSTAKFASAFALGAQVFAETDPTFSANLAARAAKAYEHAKLNPGASQTACTVSPYFYEEDNWTDDTELAAASLGKMRDAAAYGNLEPVTPWMGADSANHYQWYPFINLGHYLLAADSDSVRSAQFKEHMRQGLARTAARGRLNAFRYGVPFIWCSNNLGTALATQAVLYREVSGDNTFAEEEAAARDWLFGLNPWGQVMIIMPEALGLPSPADPHSAMTDREVAGRKGREWLAGGIVDGPVYDGIYNKLWGVHLRRPDVFAPFQGRAVYHDDYSDYSTNEPTMDGTAATTFLLGRLCGKGMPAAGSAARP